jgi:hypothetical protein
MKAQRADCHDNCGGEAELEMGVLVPWFEIEHVECKVCMSPIADESSPCFEFRSLRKAPEKKPTFSSRFTSRDTKAVRPNENSEKRYRFRDFF